MNTHTHTQINTQINTHTDEHTHTHTDKHTHTDEHRQTHTGKHKYTHTHTHTHTHTQCKINECKQCIAMKNYVLCPNKHHTDNTITLLDSFSRGRQEYTKDSNGEAEDSSAPFSVKLLFPLCVCVCVCCCVAG